MSFRHVLSGSVLLGVLAAVTARQPEPKDAGALVARGNQFFLKEDYDKAIEEYSAAIKLDPKHSFAYDGRGFS